MQSITGYGFMGLTANNAQQPQKEVLMLGDLTDYLMELEIIDTHEHLAPFEKDRPRGDVLSDFLAHYFKVDLISAGLSAEDYARVMGSDLAIGEKWRLVEPFWQVCRFTGYGQALAIAARDIYGIETIGGETIEALNDAFLQGFCENHYRKVLKEMSHIRVSVLDNGGLVAHDPDYFILANRIDALVYPQSIAQIETLEQQTGVTIASYRDYLKACAVRLTQFAAGSPVLKCGLAYVRSLDFARASRAEAAAAFQALRVSGKRPGPALSNDLFRQIVGLAQEKDMVLQIHTGLQEGNGNRLMNSHPLHLNEILLDFPRMRFDLFHIGYPYQAELGVLCKMFPHVSIDMCWAHIISPAACRQILAEWLEFIPYTKICGFGGDYRVLDGVYGHQLMARRNIAQVLEDKVRAGLFGIATAREIGKAILHDNPARIFGIA